MTKYCLLVFYLSCLTVQNPNLSNDEDYDFVSGLAEHIRDLITANPNLNSGQIANLISYPKMKYYWLTRSMDEKVIGRYNQSETAINAPQFWNDMENGRINEQMTIPEPVLHYKAILTDYLSSVPINSLLFLILKNQLVDFLKDFKIENFRKWDIKVHHKNNIVDNYSLFYLFHSNHDKYVNYKSSNFFEGNLKDYKWVGDDLKIDNSDFFLYTRKVLRDKNLILKSRKIVLNFSNASENLIRIINTPPIIGSSGYYVSEKLKDAIKEKGFTGMEFKEITELDKRIEVIY